MRGIFLNIAGARHVVPLFLFILIGTVPCFSRGLSPLQDPTKNYCIVCHDDQWQDLKASIHGQQGITCERCHGGDPTQKDKTLAKASGTGYIGVPDKTQIVQICGGCHANVEFMNVYGITTDQLAQYKTSMHGRRLFNEKDTKVAACSDCHGYHDIKDVKDPSAPVYPFNVPKTCNRCHGNKELMKSYGIKTDMFALYKDSVHGKDLFEHKDMGAATCVSCHGNHGALPPGVRRIADACGKCHMNEKDNFLKSPHAKLGLDKSFPQCIACHSNHGIQAPTTQLYDSACVRCHSHDSPEFQTGQKLKEHLEKAKQAMLLTQNLVKQASVEGIFVDDETAMLEDVKTKMLEMGPLQHTLSYDSVLKLAAQVETKSRQIQDSIRQKKQSLKNRKHALWPLWVFIMVMVTALLARYKQLHS